jgi:hypothetical protein
MQVHKYLLVPAMALGLFSCNEQDFYPVNELPVRTEVPEGIQRPTLDIMWVFDTSGSMYTHQQNVARNSPIINDVLEEIGIDFTMIATTNSSARSGFVKYLGNSGVITPDTPNWKDVFKRAVSERYSGAGVESFGNVIYDYMDTHQDFRRKFYRGGYFMLIIVTDTDDQGELHSIEDVGNLVGDYYDSEKTVYYGILCTANVRCESNWNRRDHTKNKLVQLADFFSIRRLFAVTDASYESHFQEMRKFLYTLRPVHYLRSMPRISTIKVFVDGLLVPSDPVNGWTFEPSTLGVYFNGSSAPGNDQIVRIDYQPVRHLEP